MRREALERVVAAGADPALVDVTVEIDARRNLVRATASGATAAVASGGAAPRATDDERAAAARRALHADDARLAFACGDFALFTRSAKHETSDACAVDARGVVRVTLRRAVLRRTTAARAERDLARLLEDATAFGDVGRALPDVYAIYGARVADLGTLADAAQLIALAGEELRGLDGATPVALLAAMRQA